MRFLANRGTHADVLVFDSDRTRLAYADRTGYHTDEVRSSSLAPGQGYTGRAVASEIPVFLKDEETAGHRARPADSAVSLAQYFGFAGPELRFMRWGALLHDIGKMGVPDRILLEPGKPTKEDRAAMQRHATCAYALLSPIAFLRKAVDIPYAHHERVDGRGYPRGMKGEAIPLPARIFAIVDVFDALTSDRPYRPAWSRAAALEHIRSESGRHFDPTVVDAFLKMIGEDDDATPQD